MPEQWLTNYTANDFDEQGAVQRTSRRFPAVDLVLIVMAEIAEGAKTNGSLRCPPCFPCLNVGKNLGDLQNGIPTTVRGWHAKELLDFSEITDRFHLSAIKAQNESVLDRNNLQQPLVV